MGVVYIEDIDGNVTEDWLMCWSEGNTDDGRVRARNGVDLLIDGKLIQISVTRTRKVLHIFVNHVEYVANRAINLDTG